MKDLNRIEYNLTEFISYVQQEKVVIFGAGKYGLYIYEILRKNGINIFAVCDNDKDKLNSLKDKFPVSTLEDLKNTLEEYYFVIAIAKVEIVKLIRKQLEDYGVKTDKLIIPFPDSNSDYFDGTVMFDPEYYVQVIKEHWIYTRKNHTQIRDYFEMNGLYNLIVLEIDELREWLDQDLLNSRIVIKKRIKTVDEFTENDECDAVVVLDEVNYEVIEEELMKRTEAVIISIWDIIRF